MATRPRPTLTPQASEYLFRAAEKSRKDEEEAAMRAMRTGGNQAERTEGSETFGGEPYPRERIARDKKAEEDAQRRSSEMDQMRRDQRKEGLKPQDTGVKQKLFGEDSGFLDSVEYGFDQLRRAQESDAAAKAFGGSVEEPMSREGRKVLDGQTLNVANGGMGTSSAERTNPVGIDNFDQLRRAQESDAAAKAFGGSVEEPMPKTAPRINTTLSSADKQQETPPVKKSAFDDKRMQSLFNKATGSKWNAKSSMDEKAMEELRGVIRDLGDRADKMSDTQIALQWYRSKRYGSLTGRK